MAAFSEISPIPQGGTDETNRPRPHPKSGEPRRLHRLLRLDRLPLALCPSKPKAGLLGTPQLDRIRAERAQGHTSTPASRRRACRGGALVRPAGSTGAARARRQGRRQVRCRAGPEGRADKGRAGAGRPTGARPRAGSERRARSGAPSPAGRTSPPTTWPRRRPRSPAISCERPRSHQLARAGSRSHRIPSAHSRAAVPGVRPPEPATGNSP
jgi:hypothetical protein